MKHKITHPDPESQRRIDHAIEFATKKHEGQIRKYTGEPYITHPITVAYIVSLYTDDANMIIAAIMHDTQEDCDVTNDEIKQLFGDDVAYLVDGLTHVDDGSNRASRKEKTNAKLASFDDRVKTIKIIDNLHNLGSVLKYDPKFAITYVKEARVMSEHLVGGDVNLHKKLRQVLTTATVTLNIYD